MARRKSCISSASLRLWYAGPFALHHARPLSCKGACNLFRAEQLTFLAHGVLPSVWREQKTVSILTVTEPFQLLWSHPCAPVDSNGVCAVPAGFAIPRGVDKIRLEVTPTHGRLPPGCGWSLVGGKGTTSSDATTALELVPAGDRGQGGREAAYVMRSVDVSPATRSVSLVVAVKDNLGQLRRPEVRVSASWQPSLVRDEARGRN